MGGIAEGNPVVPVKSVQLIDDVCTTGSQLDAVVGCLLEQGEAARVEGVVLARAPWRSRRVA
jgi:predicted amidophosphoribosyltransferase